MYKVVYIIRPKERTVLRRKDEDENGNEIGLTYIHRYDKGRIQWHHPYLHIYIAKKSKFAITKVYNARTHTNEPPYSYSYETHT